MAVKQIKWSGEPVTAPCMISDLPLDTYHERAAGKYAPLCDGPSISSSGLRTIFNKSPAHYWAESPMNPEGEDRTETAFLIKGRAAHHLLVGQANFAREFIIKPDTYTDDKGVEKKWTRAANICKGWEDAATQSGKTILTSEMVNDIKGMAISLGKHPLVQAGILRGLIERSIVFKDRETGIWVRVRPDAIPTDSGDYADIKTGRDVGEGADRSMREYRYDMQAGLVRWACREVGMPFASFADVFVESSAPHCVDVITIASQDLDEAEADCRTALRTFAHCLKTGDWFGPVGTQRDARTAYFSEAFRERAKFRREFLQREIGAPL